MKKILVLLVFILFISCSKREKELEVKTSELRYLKELYDVDSEISLKEQKKVIDSMIKEQREVIQEMNKIYDNK